LSSPAWIEAARQKDVMIVGECDEGEERKYSNDEINRELTTLKRILNLGRQNGKLMLNVLQPAALPPEGGSHASDRLMRPTFACIRARRLEAPPGFEPGMEVLQTGPGHLSC
jgi:hypothetical protein